MAYMRRWLAALLAAALLLTAGAGAESFSDWFFGGSDSEAGDGWDDWETVGTTPAPTLSLTTRAPSAEVPDSKIEDDGLLRVLLKSLDAPQTLNLTLSGIYAVEGDRGFRFDRDAHLMLTAQDGEVWLTIGGLALDMGPALTLTRHLDGWGEAGGLYIAEAEKQNLYCGDLSVAAGESGLEVILTIHVEDYLKGVVAYEMSDSFPLEALKAQAVAARTYAMQRKWAAGRRRYDLVDTTADQVYKGYDPEYTNVAAAVDSTRGLVGLWQGSFATCYYTASNGGQTALASQLWGYADDDGYLIMRDDPYDLENPRSLQNDLTFTAHCDGSIKLKNMLTDALGDVMEQAGYPAGTWAFDAIEDIEPIEPRFEGSRLYDKLAFDLRVRVAESALITPTPEPTATPEATPEVTPTQTPGVTPTPTPEATPEADMAQAPEPEKWVTPEETYRVTLNVFDDIKDGLSLGLNGADCELISVETQPGVDGDDAYRLVMRRFGHGVGMSQRGAQTMAGSHGMSFMEILEFYYPGMTIERMAWPESGLYALDGADKLVGAARAKPTPIPTPAPLPELSDGERYATVTTTLNLREHPTTGSRVVEILDEGRKIIVSGDPDEDGWVAARTAEVEGFVKAEYVE